MSVREIITIQCGHYSNFVGTHWWNLQESSFCYDESKKEIPEIQHDCMFREGVTLDGEKTYTPRLIAVDRSGSLGTLKKHGVLYYSTQAEETQASSWPGGISKYEEMPKTKNDFLSDLSRIDIGEMEAEGMETKMYSLQNEVKVWSDFLRIHLHPRSVVTIPDIFHDDDTCFTVFPAGQAAWTSKFKETFEEHLRFFLEECDSLQGFHLLADAGDGFGGLSSCFAEELADQFSQKTLVSFMISPQNIPLHQTPKFHSSLLSHAQCLDELCEHSSVMCPLYVLAEPWRSGCSRKTEAVLRHEHTLHYHSAAIFAAALETSTLIYRSCHAPHNMSSMANTLTKMDRKLCAMGLSFPFKFPETSSLLSELDKKPLHTQLRPLTPFCSVNDEFWSQAIALRGFPAAYPVCFKEDERHSYCRSHPSLALGTHISSQLPQCSAHFTVVNKPLVLGNPFPSIFKQTHLSSREVPSCASLQSQSGLLHIMESLSTELKKLDVRLVPSFAESSLNKDSYMELLERLQSLGDCYHNTRPLNESSDSD